MGKKREITNKNTVIEINLGRKSAAKRQKYLI